LEALKCGNCEKELNLGMEIEYSREINEFFCNPDCAKDRYFDYMGSTVLDVEDSSIMKGEGIKAINGKLFVEEDV
jgi:hypothetical protein